MFRQSPTTRPNQAETSPKLTYLTNSCSSADETAFIMSKETKRSFKFQPSCTNRPVYNWDDQKCHELLDIVNKIRLISSPPHTTLNYKTTFNTILTTQLNHFWRTDPHYFPYIFNRYILLDGSTYLQAKQFSRNAARGAARVESFNFKNKKRYYLL